MTVTWHYRGADPDLGATNAQACRDALEAAVARRWQVDVMAGKANLEVRPSFVNKGEIAKRLVLQDLKNPPGFVLCMGDDFTDEGESGVPSLEQRLRVVDSISLAIFVFHGLEEYSVTSPLRRYFLCTCFPQRPPE